MTPCRRANLIHQPCRLPKTNSPSRAKRTKLSTGRFRPSASRRTSASVTQMNVSLQQLPQPVQRNLSSFSHSGRPIITPAPGAAGRRVSLMPGPRVPTQLPYAMPPDGSRFGGAAFFSIAARGTTAVGDSMHRLIAVLMLLLSAGRGLAADCAGGSVRALRVTPDRVTFAGTVTRASLTHENASTGGLQLVLEDARDGTVVYQTSVPAERFVVRPDATTYDGGGTLDGSVRVRDTRRQADTVQVTLRDAR